MAAAQQALLEAIRDVLAGGGTDAGARVFLDRLDALAEADLPALLVEESPEGETVADAGIDGLEERTLVVLVTSVVAHSTEYASNARALALQAEKLIAADDMPAQLLALRLTRVRLAASRIVLDGEGKKAQAARVQTWQLTYFVRPHAPDVPV